MPAPNRALALLTALLILVAGLVPATAAPLCGPEPGCAPCGRLPADARMGAASCCCGDLAAAESAIPEVAEGAVTGGVSSQVYHAVTSPAEPKVAATGSGSVFHARVHRRSPVRPPLFQLYQSLLI